jgi:hypothetical protein
MCEMANNRHFTGQESNFSPIYMPKEALATHIAAIGGTSLRR